MKYSKHFIIATVIIFCFIVMIFLRHIIISGERESTLSSFRSESEGEGLHVLSRLLNFESYREAKIFLEKRNYLYDHERGVFIKKVEIRFFSAVNVIELYIPDSDEEEYSAKGVAFKTYLQGEKIVHCDIDNNGKYGTVFLLPTASMPRGGGSVVPRDWQ